MQNSRLVESRIDHSKSSWLGDSRDFWEFRYEVYATTGLTLPLGEAVCLSISAFSAWNRFVAEGGSTAMFSIGEFSRITGLTVKTLRHYHKEGLLVPSYVDEQTGYRYYDAAAAERARVIAQLRRLEFSIAHVREILASCAEDADLVEYLERQKTVLKEKIRHHRNVVRSLDEVITIQRESDMSTQQATFEIEEKTVEPLLVAGVRMKGRYDQCGKGFSKIGRALGRHLCGKPLCLYYDGEYKENDADFEPCIPVRKSVTVEGISIRELPGGRCVSLVYQGPYGEPGHHRAYERVFDYAKQHGYQLLLPSREVYLKGPGMIFRGNPKKYRTEIQVFVDEGDAGS